MTDDATLISALRILARDIESGDGSMVHAASHPGYEGVGVGGSPGAALASCCNNGGAVLEEGTAQGRDGRWYACRRYSLR